MNHIFSSKLKSDECWGNPNHRQVSHAISCNSKGPYSHFQSHLFPLWHLFKILFTTIISTDFQLIYALRKSRHPTDRISSAPWTFQNVTSGNLWFSFNRPNFYCYIPYNIVCPFLYPLWYLTRRKKSCLMSTDRNKDLKCFTIMILLTLCRDGFQHLIGVQVFNDLLHQWIS